MASGQRPLCKRPLVSEGNGGASLTVLAFDGAQRCFLSQLPSPLLHNAESMKPAVPRHPGFSSGEKGGSVLRTRRTRPRGCSRLVRVPRLHTGLGAGSWPSMTLRAGTGSRHLQTSQAPLLRTDGLWDRRLKNDTQRGFLILSLTYSRWDGCKGFVRPASRGRVLRGSALSPDSVLHAPLQTVLQRPARGLLPHGPIPSCPCLLQTHGVPLHWTLRPPWPQDYVQTRSTAAPSTRRRLGSMNLACRDPILEQPLVPQQGGSKAPGLHRKPAPERDQRIPSPFPAPAPPLPSQPRGVSRPRSTHAP